MIQAARSSWGKSPDEILRAFDKASEAFNRAAKEKFGKAGEW